MLVGICQKYLQALIAEPLVTTVDFDRARIGPLRLTWEEVEGRASSKVLIGDLEPDNDRPPAVVPQTFLTCLFHVHPKLVRGTCGSSGSRKARFAASSAGHHRLVGYSRRKKALDSGFNALIKSSIIGLAEA